MINASNLKRGAILEVDDAPWLVIEVAFQSPSARGASTLTKVRVRNLITGAVLRKSFRSGDMLQEADCEKRKAQFLYRDADQYCLMDEESFEQFELGEDVVGDEGGFLLEGMSVQSLLYNGHVVSIELPNTVELEVVETTPNIKGATAQAQMKPAVLETGITIQVPPYLDVGTRIRVDTREKKFVERVK